MIVPTALSSRPLLAARAAAPAMLLDAAAALDAAASVPTSIGDVTTSLAFADQAGKLAGVLFPLSLPPYLLFLYFICQDVNGLSPTAKAGFTSLLGFVVATVITSIISTKSYGLPLADVDWLHSGAEQLLSFTNIADVVGLKLTLDAFSAAGGVSTFARPLVSTFAHPLLACPAGGTTPAPSSEGSSVLPLISGAALVTLAATWAAAGGTLAEHSAYLGGVGNLPSDLWTFGFAEPANALSLPTWVIHLSSLLEWLVAMCVATAIPTVSSLGTAVITMPARPLARRGLVWRLATVSGNPKWKGLTWGMIPSHSSGVCACVYHLFYNAPALQFVVTLQAALTLLGNCTLAFAAWRLASSNGWTFSLPTFGQDDATDIPTGAVTDSQRPAASAAAAAAGSDVVDASGGNLGGLALILVWSTLGSYVVKYGETMVPLFADGESPAVPIAATLLIVSATGFNMWKWQQRSQRETDFGGLI